MKLEDIASVRSGLVLSRKQAQQTSKAQYRLLNLRSIHSDGYIDPNQLDIFHASEPLSPDYLSQAGDVIVRLSIPHTAVLIDHATADIVISSNFVIIRTDRSKLLPEYLFWLLNTSQVKQAIYKNTGANMLGAIKATFFSEFEISLPPLDKQQKIAAMYQLAQKETMLLRQLANEKERYYNHLIDQAYKEIKRGK